MKKIFTLFLAICSTFFSFSQDLPKGWADGEKEKMPAYLEQVKNNEGFNKSLFTTVPPYTKLRNAAEWEEIQTLVITWTSFTAIHREIIKAAQLETKITIICSDSNVVKNNLIANLVPLTNLKYIIAPFNSIWMRDYFGNSVYGKYIDSLILVDWIYNRPRPLDDVIPTVVANNMNIPIYETKVAPNDIIHTGGNYMSDGFGTAFSSQLTDTENPSHTAAAIDTIMKKYMGINRYIRFPVLPFDGIHHIDMHMKLLDEETLLVGQYPVGVADGPQIEANLQYIVANYNSVFGTPYKVIRIPMPKDKNNKWPNQSGGWYCTYTNGVFVNKTYIFPTYYQQYDTTAFRILTQSLPGYKIVGIDCDNGSSPIISQSGAIHCITHCVNTNDPLLISHQPRSLSCDTGNYLINAKIMHRSGISSAKVYWTIDTLLGYTQTNMSLVNPTTGMYSCNIPVQAAGDTVYYYIGATAVNGKTMTRPMTAPLGRYRFKIQACNSPTSLRENALLSTKPIYPNPASFITCIPLSSNITQNVKVTMLNILGQTVDIIYDGEINAGEKNVFLHAENYAKGVYFIEAKTATERSVQKLLIR